MGIFSEDSTNWSDKAQISAKKSTELQKLKFTLQNNYIIKIEALYLDNEEEKDVTTVWKYSDIQDDIEVEQEEVDLTIGTLK